MRKCDKLEKNNNKTVKFWGKISISVFFNKAEKKILYIYNEHLL